ELSSCWRGAANSPHPTGWGVRGWVPPPPTRAPPARGPPRPNTTNTTPPPAPPTAPHKHHGARRCLAPAPRPRRPATRRPHRHPLANHGNVMPPYQKIDIRHRPLAHVVHTQVE